MKVLFALGAIALVGGLVVVGIGIDRHDLPLFSLGFSTATLGFNLAFLAYNSSR